MKNLKFEILNERIKNEKYYALACVSTERGEAYCAIVQDDELVVQDLGFEKGRAKEIYELLIRGEVSSLHVEEIVRDLKNEIFT